MTTHVLKTLPQYYERLADGTKTFEVRRDDRGFQTGDVLDLREHDPARCKIGRCVDEQCPAWTGRSLRFRVGFTFKQGVGCDLGEYVVMSLLPDEEVAR